MLYLLKKEEIPEKLPEVNGYFGPELSQYLGRLRNPGRYRESLTAYLVLETALYREYGTDRLPDITRDEKGKPHFGSGLPQFSLSHCPEGIAAALSRYPVGADIEQCRACRPELARRICSPAEYGWPLILLWTAKESYLKLEGCGLGRDLRTVEPDRLRKEKGLYCRMGEEERFAYTVWSREDLGQPIYLHRHELRIYQRHKEETSYGNKSDHPMEA